MRETHRAKFGKARKITPTAINAAVRMKEHINVTMHGDFAPLLLGVMVVTVVLFATLVIV